MSADEWWREGVIYQVYPRSFELPSPPGVWPWQRGAGTTIALNLSVERVDGRLSLGSWEGAICSSAST